MDDEQLKKLREKRMKELKKQQAESQANDQIQRMQQEKQKQYENQKKQILMKVLSSDARVRLTNIRMARPQFAQALERQLIALFQRGQLKNDLPLSDQQFKNLLKQIHQK